jgi:hypothetical protein
LRRKALAVIAACSALFVSLASSKPTASAPAAAISDATCQTGDLEEIMAIYGTSPEPKLTPAPIPSHARSYLAQLLAQRLNACARELGSAGSACIPDRSERSDPRALWRQLSLCKGLVELPNYTRERVIPSVLVYAAEPTIYVLLGSGAPSGPPPPSSAGSSSHGGGGGAASGSTATGSAVDNPDAFLLFLLAQHLENSICERAVRPQPDPSDRRTIDAIDAGCQANHDRYTRVAVVAESQWTVEDFRAQCIEDPYSNQPGKTSAGPHGTVGGIILNGAIVTHDGTFNILTVTGGSEANFTAQVVDCTGGDAARPPLLSAVWSDNISDGNKTTAFSLFPVALAGTILEARWAARAASLPAPNPSSSPGILGAYVDYETGVAFGTFAGAASGLTIGNPSSGLTLRHSFEAWSRDFTGNLYGFCESQGAGVQPPICVALNGGQAP